MGLGDIGVARASNCSEGFNPLWAPRSQIWLVAVIGFGFIGSRIAGRLSQFYRRLKSGGGSGGRGDNEWPEDDGVERRWMMVPVNQEPRNPSTFDVILTSSPGRNATAESILERR
ncbi:hypothetical protein CRG98_035064 [Punica granatum]|uniref:Uncharacterized protein n=1 Tax=Punica granatum TaxID=22663 RepID=A0A2I0IMD6_PUNGR|nr:hypothetical protein CRG98_035064 [Punica granatum]